MRSIIASAFAFAASCIGGNSGGKSGRYTTARDPGSRYDFRYVKDRETKRWVQRECELRVSVNRRMPDPLVDPEHGNRLQVSLNKPGSTGSAGVMRYTWEIRDGFRVVPIRDVLHEEDLAGRISYGVTVSWPHKGQSTEFDAYEIFEMPALGNTPPDTWSQWRTASALREGAFGWWEQAHEKPPSDVKGGAHPFEMRCRLILTDNPVLIP